MFGWRAVVWCGVAVLAGGCQRVPATAKGGAGEDWSSDGGSTSSSGGNTSDDGTTSSSTPSGGGTTSTGGDSTGGTTITSSDTGGGAFIEEPDHGVHVPCHVTEQDCPEGEKCVPWCDDGGNAMNSVKCVPIPDDPKAPWEPCVSEGGQCSGVDDCDIGSVCWSSGTWQGPGVCHSLCLEEGECPHPDEYCPLFADPWLCLPKCDPLLQACEDGESCQEVAGGFTCRPHDAAAGADGAECDRDDDCLSGHVCVRGDWLSDCAGWDCCTPLCDASLPEVCPADVQGEVCIASFPYFEYDYVGVCRLP